MSVLDDVAAERQRQIGAGFDALHDDAHERHEIICHPTWGAMARVEKALRSGDRLDLIQAAAMIVAEVERLDRAAVAAPRRD